MKRAQSMAQSAWSRPAQRISAWSCIGPRRRSTVQNKNTVEDSSSSSSTKKEDSEPFLTTIEDTTVTDQIENHVSLSDGIGLRSLEKRLSEITLAEVDDNEDVMDHVRHEDRMTEVELWQQLERELYEKTESEEADTVKEIRDEEAAAVAEATEGESQSSVPDTKEVHRFFPPGRILHIVTISPDEEDNVVESESSSTSSEADDDYEEETVGIFLTSRSLYTKLRLSRTMITDHFMPIYRKQIEKVIKELESEGTCVDETCLETL